MEFSIEILKIVIFLAPGILSMLLIEKLTTHKKISFDRFSMYAILLSLFVYLVHYLFWIVAYELYCKFEWNFLIISQPEFILFDFLKEQNLIQTYIYSFIWLLIISFILSIIVTYIINKKTINRFGRYINITTKYGDESVWDYFHNSNTDWVVVRDIKNDLMYFGWISVFSDYGNEFDELLLQNVTVYKNSTGEKMYEVDKAYIAGKREELRIEVHNYKEKKNV